MAELNDNWNDEQILVVKHLIKKLQNAGWRRYRNVGAFSEILKRNNVITKIFCDEAYLAYLGFIAKHPNNKHLPKVLYGPKQHKENVWIVRLEKLDPVSKNKRIKKADHFTLESGLHKYFHVPRTTRIEFARKESTRKLRGNVGSVSHLQASERKTLNSIVDFTNKSRFYKDLNLSNMATRGQDLVFLDPICATY